MKHLLRITALRPNGAHSFTATATVVDGEWSETDPPLRWFQTSCNMTPREAVVWMRGKGWTVEIEEA